MSIVTTRSKIGTELLLLLQEKFGVPKSAYDLKLHIQQDGIIQIEVGYYPEETGDVDGGEGKN